MISRFVDPSDLSRFISGNSRHTGLRRASDALVMTQAETLPVRALQQVWLVVRFARREVELEVRFSETTKFAVRVTGCWEAMNPRPRALAIHVGRARAARCDRARRRRIEIKCSMTSKMSMRA